MVSSTIIVFILIAFASAVYIYLILFASADKDKSYLSDEEAEEQWKSIERFLHKKSCSSIR